MSIEHQGSSAWLALEQLHWDLHQRPVEGDIPQNRLVLGTACLVGCLLVWFIRRLWPQIHILRNIFPS